MTESFLRQRRNLIVVNGIFLFTYFAKVNVSKLTIIGMSFEGFGNPEVIYIFLWIILGYFYYRYHIYFRENEYEKFMLYFEIEMENAVNDKLLKIVSEKYPDRNDNYKFSYKGMKTNGWNLHCQIYVEKDEQKTVENIVHKINRSDIWMSETIGILRFLLLSPAVTDYILPVVMTFSVFVICGFGNWGGALLS